ncbi:MAG: zinc finger AN1 domain-containing stress-associated protein [Thermoproteota archaeon]
MLQRCHVCGRVDETCKPCEHCGWWFCGKHIDPEQHGCTGLKILRQAAVKPERQEKPEETVMLIPLERETPSLEKPIPPASSPAAGSLLDENLSEGLAMLKWMVFLHLLGNFPIIAALTFLNVITFAIGSLTSLSSLIALNPVVAIELLIRALSFWSFIYNPGDPISILMTIIFMLSLLSVGGIPIVSFVEFNYLLSAFNPFKDYDESFGKPIMLFKIGRAGFLMFPLSLIAMLIEAAVVGRASTTLMLMWVWIIMLALGQIGLALGLFKLRKKLGDSRFSTAATMFIINLVLSLALSPLAVVAGLAGWVLTSLATRAALKRKVSQTVYT